MIYPSDKDPTTLIQPMKNSTPYKRRAALIATGAALSLFSSGSASAEQTEQRSSGPTATVTSANTAYCEGFCYEPSRDNNVRVNIKLGQKYSSISELCITTYFGNNDQLDPGEAAEVLGVGGYLNTDSSALSSRTFCAEAGNHNEFLANFEDGRGTAKIFSARPGGFIIDHVDVAVSGTPK